MFTLFMRAILVYAIVLIIFRVMGKRQLGQLQPFEFVLTLIVADLATIPMAEDTVPILHGIIPLLTLVTVHFILTICTKKSILLNKLISGKPVIVINPSGIDYQALEKLNISIDDLFEGIRCCGFFSIDEIQYAIVETNGSINVLPKKDYSPITPSAKENPNEETSIPITIINDGVFVQENAQVAGLDKNFVDWILKKTKIKDIKKVLICTIDSNDKVFFQEKQGTGQNLTYNKKRLKNEKTN